jgi:hypothetical protein
MASINILSHAEWYQLYKLVSANASQDTKH